MSKNNQDTIKTNVTLLASFLNRYSFFHDEKIKSVNSLNGRVIIEIGGYILCVLGVKKFSRCEIPDGCMSLDVIYNGKVEISIVTCGSKMLIIGNDIRLIRAADYVVVIPNIDGFNFSH